MMTSIDNSPSVTVIVPAYNEAARIGACVDSLTAQSYPTKRLQIIVVDNGSSDGTFELLQRMPGIEALRETQPGSYAARNLALRHARGDIVCFTDADCQADRDWVRNACAHLADPGVGIVAGHVELDFGNHPSLTASELFEKCFAFRQADNARDGVCVTANWCSPRALVERLGGFDSTVKSGGDHKLSKSIVAAGYRIVFASDAVVRHPARTSFHELTSKRRRVIGGVYNTQCRDGRKSFPVFLASLLKETLLRMYSVATRVQLRAIDRVRLNGLLMVLCGISLTEAVRLQLGGEARR
jgi:glycosyltransferase involved in cell wall biosynthesis